MTRSIVLVALALLAAFPAAAQVSASYRLEEHTFNAGGRPDQGAIASSASFRVRFDAIGEAAARDGLQSPSYHVDAGFPARYPAPDEVRGLRFADRQTLRWEPERSIGTYDLYRGLLTTLSGLAYGTCFAFGMTDTTAIDAGTPPRGNGWFYLATAVNRLREEGTKGWQSSGLERANPAPCP